MMSNRRVSFLRTYYTCIKMYNNGKCISAKYLNVCEHAIISFMLYCVIVFVVDSGLFFLLCDWPWTDISQFWHGQFTILSCPWIFTKTAVLNREKRTVRAQNCKKKKKKMFKEKVNARMDTRRTQDHDISPAGQMELKINIYFFLGGIFLTRKGKQTA